MTTLDPVKTPTGSEYTATWDENTGQVYVGGENAGQATSKEDAWRKANYYATTLSKMK
jgi:hypothetical protein